MPLEEIEKSSTNKQAELVDHLNTLKCHVSVSNCLRNVLRKKIVHFKLCPLLTGISRLMKERREKSVIVKCVIVEMF